MLLKTVLNLGLKKLCQLLTLSDYFPVVIGISLNSPGGWQIPCGAEVSQPSYLGQVLRDKSGTRVNQQIALVEL